LIHKCSQHSVFYGLQSVHVSVRAFIFDCFVFLIANDSSSVIHFQVLLSAKLEGSTATTTTVDAISVDALYYCCYGSTVVLICSDYYYYY